MTASPTLETGRVVAGRYRVERQIGAGGVGSVYLVRHVHTDEELALKVLQTHALKDADAVERFRKEARAPARIGSEHVTRVTDADTAPDLDNAPFLVMELLRGRDLTKVVEEDGPLPAPRVVELLRQAARALDKAHGLGIVHRDLKPDNLFLTEREDGSPCIKLLDFGIARIGDAAPGDRKTQAGLVFGTPGYMAPEQMTGEMDLVSPATDVWALGLVAFYLLVGRDLWSAETLVKLYAMVLNEPIPLPSQRGAAFGDAFDAWFLRCVARDPKARFQTAGEAVIALRHALGLRVSSPPVSLPPLDRISLEPADGRARMRSDPPPFTAPLLPPAPVTQSVPPFRDSQRSMTGIIVGAAVVGLLIVVASVVVTLRLLGSHEGDVAVASPSAPPSASVAMAAAPPLPVTPAAKAPPVQARAPSDTPADDGLGERAAPEAPMAAPRDTTPTRPMGAPRGGNRREQQERLDALQRLCDQGTVTAAECAAKRAAILRGDP